MADIAGTAKKDFVKALNDGTASVFLGAGMSSQAGYPTWKELVHELAGDLGLDSTKETDLAGLVQYYLNKRGTSRTRLSQVIQREFGRHRDIPNSHRIISRLPIRTVWTTNYDQLMERAWELSGKRVVTKFEDAHLSVPDPALSHTIFKMHGTVQDAPNVVIARDDYDLYRKRRPAFLTHLASELVSKRFLFLGLSFTDPNLLALFSWLREHFSISLPLHYGILKRPQRHEFSGRNGSAEFNYQVNRFGLWTDDMERRYGIEPIIVDSFPEIETVLGDIETTYSRRSVFVSGSYSDANPDKTKLDELCRLIGRTIAKRNLRLVCGFGENVGPNILAGAFEVWRNQPHFDPNQMLLLRPFPKPPFLTASERDFVKKYREDLIAQAGICIFVAGEKDGKPAQGVKQEFAIACDASRVPIPIGSSGFAAEKLWPEVKSRFGEFFPARVHRVPFNILNDQRVSLGKSVAALDKMLDQLTD